MTGRSAFIQMQPASPAFGEAKFIKDASDSLEDLLFSSSILSSDINLILQSFDFGVFSVLLTVIGSDI